MGSRHNLPGYLIRTAIPLFFCLAVFIPFLKADVIINVLTVNPKDQPLEKNVEFSLPGEIKPEDVIDPAGLKIDYNDKDAGYYLHGKIDLAPKETRTLRVKIRDVWKISDEKIAELKGEIDRGYKEMGTERNPENAARLHQKLLDKLNYIASEQDQASGSMDARIDAYRNHVQTLADISSRANLIDYWRMDADSPEPNKIVNLVVEVSNPTDKNKKSKTQGYLPKEVKPEYIVDRQGFEVRFDAKRGQPFLFKEQDLAPNTKIKVSVGVRDMWYVPGNELKYVREHSQYVIDSLSKSPFIETAKTLYNAVVNNLDLIDALQAQEQPDIQQHIGAYRINAGRFEQAKKDLDALEKLLARYRSDLEKSKVKNIMQKIQQLKSLAKVSQAIFDKKPTVNAAWKIIGAVMLFLAFFTIIHFVTWFLRSAREKKQEEIKYAQKKEEPQE